MKHDRPSTDAQDPVTLANKALDGDLSFDDALVGGGAEHIRSVRRVERLLSIESHARTAPDLTSVVLSDVGARRGWLDTRSRALVWGGRGLIAATLLAALAVTLSVRRAAPEFGPNAREAAALASVVDAGERAAASATAPLATVVETIETGTPFLATLTGTIEAPAQGSCEMTFARGRQHNQLTPSHGGRVIVVNATLDPASQRTVDAVCGDAGSPRWLRAGRLGHNAHEHD